MAYYQKKNLKWVLNHTEPSPKNTACIVIDMQMCYCHPKGSLAKSKAGVGSYNTEPIQEMVPYLRTFLQNLRTLGVEVIFTRMNEDPVAMPRNAAFKRTHINAPPVGAKGTKDFEYYDDPKINLEDVKGVVMPDESRHEEEFIKFLYDPFSNRNFKNHLKKYDNLIITGVHGSVCVPASIERAFTEGYNIFVPTYENDKMLVSTFKERLGSQALRFDIMDEIFIYLIDKDILLKQLGKK